MKFYILSVIPLFLFCQASCSAKSPGTVDPAGQSPAVSIADGSAQVKDGFTASGQQIAEGYGMTYSETAADEVIPALPIFGFANGQPFNAGTVIFRLDHKGQWHLEVSDKNFDPTKGPLDKANTQTFYITLSAEPKAGIALSRKMEYGGGYFQIKHPSANSNTTSWNTSFTYKIELQAWEMGEVKAESCGVPKIGRATGKLFVSFKGSEEEGRVKNSWLSGQFKDAAIIYCG